MSPAHDRVIPSTSTDIMLTPVDSIKTVESSTPMGSVTSEISSEHQTPTEPIKTSSRNVDVPNRQTSTPTSIDDTHLSDPGLRSVQFVESTIPSPDHVLSLRRREQSSLYEPLLESSHRPNSSSSFLQPGSRFSGIQSSESQKYEVVVDIQHVDMANSFLCGYLKIKGLALEHPTLTTYFEGEIIGSKYSFLTQHPEWGAREKLDMEHWGKFRGFRTHARDAKKPGYAIRNWQNKEHIWMRWKEYFLVPDHRVKDLAGASFEGFYYICFNQITGNVEGIYYHAKSPRFQTLDLQPEKSRGFQFGFEFR